MSTIVRDCLRGELAPTFWPPGSGRLAKLPPVLRTSSKDEILVFAEHKPSQGSPSLY